jgi:hypothetical protein
MPTGPERFAMMSATVPFMADPGADVIVSTNEPELVQRFVQYCGDKNLNQAVLLAGTLLLDLGMVSVTI